MLQVYISSVSEVYIISVSDGYCKSRSGCYIRCNSCTRMLQAFVPNVSFVFGTYVQVYLFGCYICFTHMLQVFHLNAA
jgi:hypothetical protein